MMWGCGFPIPARAPFEEVYLEMPPCMCDVREYFVVEYYIVPTHVDEYLLDMLRREVNFTLERLLPSILREEIDVAKVVNIEYYAEYLSECFFVPLVFYMLRSGEVKVSTIRDLVPSVSHVVKEIAREIEKRTFRNIEDAIEFFKSKCAERGFIVTESRCMAKSFVRMLVIEGLHMLDDLYSKLLKIRQVKETLTNALEELRRVFHEATRIIGLRRARLNIYYTMYVNANGEIL